MNTSSQNFFIKILLIASLSFSLSSIAHAEENNFFVFTKDLRLGDKNVEVKKLQQYLNSHGAPVTASGVGSRGAETELFGQKTKEAVARFQELHAASILTPFELLRGTGNFFASTRNFINATGEPKAAKSSPSGKAEKVVLTANKKANYSLGGKITGLSGPVLITENSSGETIKAEPNGSANFVFAHLFASGDSYNITAKSLAGTQLCYLSKDASGIMAERSIYSINIQCSSSLLGNPFESALRTGTSYALGGTVSGLSGTLVLQTSRGDRLTLTSNGSFSFGSRVAQDSSYLVTVYANPTSPAQICSISNGSGTATGNISNIAITCAAPTTTLSVAARATIPVSSDLSLTTTLTVTNTGTNEAKNISLDLSGLTCSTSASDINQDISSCTSLLPAESCNITLSSRTACLAKGNIAVSADNITNSPTTALAFSMSGYLVFALSSPSADEPQVIDSVNLANTEWGPSDVSGVTMDDGATNTTLIVNTFGTDEAHAAGVTCHNSTNGGATVGTWYLPALCQMQADGYYCTNNLNTSLANLNQLGFTNLLDSYWSSSSYNSIQAWGVYYQAEELDNPYGASILFRSFIFVKTLCARSIAY